MREEDAAGRIGYRPWDFSSWRSPTVHLGRFLMDSVPDGSVVTTEYWRLEHHSEALTISAPDLHETETIPGSNPPTNFPSAREAPPQR